MKTNYIESALRVLDIEGQALFQLKIALNEDFTSACNLMKSCTGKVIVMGMGKSGHICRKIAATLSSTGTSAFYIHPGEACHGDSGTIGREDVILILSNSGETSEVLQLIPVFKRLGTPIISITNKEKNSLSEHSDVNLYLGVNKEACPLGLAPTASTTAALALGDSLAIALLESKGFTSEDFALSHPSGSLGRKLLLRVEDVMRSGGSMPLVETDTLLTTSVIEMTKKGLGMTGVVNTRGRLVGIFTDGDLRRLLNNQVDIRGLTISQVMTVASKTIFIGTLVSSALRVMEDSLINSMFIVTEDNFPVGAVNMHILIREGA